MPNALSYIDSLLGNLKMPNMFINSIALLGNCGDTVYMSVVVDVILEESERLRSLIELYDGKIAELPKGSLSEKSRGNRLYCYLAYRDGSRVKFKYIGPQGSEEVQRIHEQIAQRRVYEERRRESVENLKQVEKLINVAIR